MSTPDVETMLAKQEITEVMYRYCRAMDRMDRKLAESIWHSDGTTKFEDAYTTGTDGETVHVGGFEGTAAGFLDYVWPWHEQGFLCHSHQVSNILIEVDGDSASSEAYMTACLRSKPADEHGELIVRGRYLDRWSKREGRWAIDHRLYVGDMTETRTVAEPYIVGLLSRRDADDPSYHMDRSSQLG